MLQHFKDIFNNKQLNDPTGIGNRSTRHKITGLVVLLVFCVLGGALLKSTHAATIDSFTFGTGGDHSASSDAAKVMQGVGAQNLDFFLSLGDLSYNDVTPGAWCQFVKDNINIGAGKAVGDTYGENFPFQLTMGNHETTNFDQFLACLPDHMASTVMPGSTYGRDYYFDYPSGTPLARFVVMAPNLGYTFTNGSPQYQWLSSTIDQARAAGIKWVIVSDHENYISSGTTGNSIGADFFNLLVDKKVDLVLEGHDHTYQRSHQLAFGPNCSNIARNPANKACVSGDGSTGQYTKGNGTVLVIDGASGQLGRTVSTGDSDYPYFAKIAGNVNGVYPSGFNKITVTADSLTSSFVNTNGGNMVDNFTIGGSGTSTTPPPTSTPPPATVTTKTFAPDADATVKKGSPTTNFGTNGRLQADSSPVINSLMRFTVSGTAGYGITGAKLRMYVADASPDGGSLYRVADNSWGESTVTYNTAPAADVLPFASVGAATAGKWVEVDVSKLINGDGTYSLELTSANADQVSYYSRNAAANHPQLVLTLDPNTTPDTTPPSTPTGLTATALSSSEVKLSWSAATDDRSLKGYTIQRNGEDIDDLIVTGTSYTDTGLVASTAYTYTVTAVDNADNVSQASNAVTVTTGAVELPMSVTLSPVADTTIKKGSPTSNYGTLARIYTKTGVQESLLKFTVTGSNGRIPTSAKLRLYNTDASPDGGSVYPVADSSWTETGVTWNNAPAIGTTKVASFGAVQIDSWDEVDLSNLITGDGTYSIAITTTSSDLAAYYSRNSKTDGPQLIVNY